MGNKYSTPNKPMIVVTELDPDPEPDYLAEFFAKEPEGQYETIDDLLFHEKAGKMYYKIQREKPDIYVEKHIEIFVDKDNDIALPYESSKMSLSSDTNEPIVTSENMKYIEMYICRGNIDELVKYPVHKNTPDHDCKGNCDCIKQTFQYDPQTRTITRSSDNPYNLSATSTVSPGQYKGKECRMAGGAFDDTSSQGRKGVSSTTSDSPEEISDSDETRDKLFSETSEMKDMSTTDTTPIKDKKQKQKQKVGESDLEDIEFDEEEEETNEETFIEESDDIDEGELEGIIDEETSEAGIILSQSDITSSDLYRLHRVVFRSETDSDTGSDAEFTAQVEMAMNQARRNERNTRKNKSELNQRNNLFDTEENDMLDMGSENKTSSDRLTRKSTKKNIKYN